MFIRGIFAGFQNSKIKIILSLINLRQCRAKFNQAKKIIKEGDDMETILMNVMNVLRDSLLYRLWLFKMIYRVGFDLAQPLV